jgi:hypothetical protein
LTSHAEDDIPGSILVEQEGYRVYVLDDTVAIDNKPTVERMSAIDGCYHPGFQSIVLPLSVLMTTIDAYEEVYGSCRSMPE